MTYLSLCCHGSSLNFVLSCNFLQYDLIEFPTINICFNRGLSSKLKFFVCLTLALNEWAFVIVSGKCYLLLNTQLKEFLPVSTLENNGRRFKTEN